MKMARGLYELSKEITGTFFMREAMNSFRYTEILQQFVITFQASENVPNSAWFMKDDFRSHSSPEVFNFLRFGE
ncbi:hypothetical protein CEXT_416601 [Caerostris extrusa]|uniref:Uncharacterized protein n=1 Tax=Caerostris extrusa TaxID=172846 RepID=A0AAV4NA30_CAEEX|nr:hypothetical protein CEXT_416601 [Caerostris extrusa]